MRFLGDEGKVTPVPASNSELRKPSRCEVQPLACMAKRLPARRLAIVQQLLRHDEDLHDPQLPLLLWWALEQHASVGGRSARIVHLFSRLADAAPTTSSSNVGAAMRPRDRSGPTACAQLLESAPSAERRRGLLAALDLGLQDRPIAGKNSGTLLTQYAVQERPTTSKDARPLVIPPPLARQLADLWSDDTIDARLLRVLLRLGDGRGQQRALTLATDENASRASRLAMIDVLGELGNEACVAPLLKLAAAADVDIQLHALAALRNFDNESVANTLLQLYPRLRNRVQTRAADVLLSRLDWARNFLLAIDQGKLPAKDVSVEQLRPLSWHNDPQLDALIRKHWGAVTVGTPEEKLAEIRRLNNDLRAGSGDALKGRELYRKQCATCHRLFGEGNQVGPDLTFANRKDRDYLLVSLIDPSAVIRKEFLSYVVQTTDGRLLTGLLVEQTPQHVVLVGATNERTAIPRQIRVAARVAGFADAGQSAEGREALRLRDLFRICRATALQVDFIFRALQPPPMWLVIQRLSRGFALIALASGVLLAFDVKRSGTNRLPQIAILQHASTVVLDDGVRGMVDGLAEQGFRNGEAAAITTYNAQGDMAMSAAIAREITDGRYDLVLTSSTPSMQAVANANKDGRTTHVFGLVADPYVTGVGLDRANPLAHPRHLVGYGLFLPAADAFRLARRMLPSLQSVGVAWNPAEANSRMFVGKAREACQELGITLLETQVENSAGVLEATQSLIGRGAQAIWVGGDIAVSSALDTVLRAAQQAHIPVFSILPGGAEGTIFDLGLDFYAAGRLSGELAAQILQGTDPGTIPIRDAIDVVPRRLLINQKALQGLKDRWQVPDDLLRQADVVVDANGVRKKADKASHK